MKHLAQSRTFEKTMTLRTFRNIVGMPQKVIAPIMKVSQSTLSRMENEDKELNEEQIEKMIKMLGLKAEDLLKYEGNLIFIGNNFKNSKEVNYKKDTTETENELSKGIILELKEEIKELKIHNQRQVEQIQRLFELLEVKNNILQ